MADLQEIATDLNVSLSLVSKVLNGRLGTSGVSPRTAARIRHRAVELGYRKNISAAGLASGRHNVIGVFLHSVGVAGSGITEEMVIGVSNQAATHNQRLLLRFFTDDSEFRAAASEVDKNLLDGVIIGGLMHRELIDECEAFETRGIPIVSLYDQGPERSLVNVRCDQVEVGRVATAHLIERGCRTIAHISTMGYRTEGITRAINAAGLVSAPELAFPAPRYTYEMGELAVKQFVASGLPFDGVVAQSDQQAAGVINALQRLGRRVPDSVKVIGVDNSPFCDFHGTPISSVSQEFVHQAKVAVDLLMAKINGQSVESMTIAPVLHMRDSSAPLQ